MKKKSLIIVASVIVIISLTIVLLMKNNKLELPKLEADDISNVYYHKHDKNETGNLDIEQFLVYYNQIYNIRDNVYGAGTTPDSSIVIELKAGDEIRIINSGDQFEVSFYNSEREKQQYWGKQQEIKNMLVHGFYRLED